MAGQQMSYEDYVDEVYRSILNADSEYDAAIILVNSAIEIERHNLKNENFISFEAFLDDLFQQARSDSGLYGRKLLKEAQENKATINNTLRALAIINKAKSR